MNKHTRSAQKEWIHGDNWEDKRAEEFDMTMKIIVTLLFCSGWIYLMKSIADWLMTL